MFGRDKEATAARATANLKRAVKTVPANLPKAVNEAANRGRRGKPKP